MKLENILLPNRSSRELFDVEYQDDKVLSITPRSRNTGASTDTPPSLLLPALCHPHVHLDKAYLLTSNVPTRDNENDANDGYESDQPRRYESDYPDYSDLSPSTGTFAEALEITAQAKTRYTQPDLFVRGAQLIEDSIFHGVTAMRVFVEIDHVTEMKTLSTAIMLKQRYNRHCHVQICAFAQDPIISGEHGPTNRKLMEEALTRFKGWIDVLGTTPYVEDTFENGLENASWAIDTAMSHDLHLDFHLDYHLDEDKTPMVFDVVRLLDEKGWVPRRPQRRPCCDRFDTDTQQHRTEAEAKLKANQHDDNKPARTPKTICLGHCTRMTLFTSSQLHTLAHKIKHLNLPISFVGLPTSDLFMMGRPDTDEKQKAHQPRGTLHVLDLIQKYNLQACSGVNNVGNAFTPWGDGDPLRLASLGVGIFQTGRAKDAKLLYECVSTRARRAIGLDDPNLNPDSDQRRGTFESTWGVRAASNDEELVDDFEPSRFIKGGMLVIDNEKFIMGVGGGCSELEDIGSGPIPARQRVSIRDVVWDPPQAKLRRLIYGDVTYPRPRPIA